MSSDRKNIKTDQETFDELNELRKELDLEWTPFLQTAIDAIHTVHSDNVDEDIDETTLDDIARIIKSEHESTRSAVPESTLRGISERF